MELETIVSWIANAIQIFGGLMATMVFLQLRLQKPIIVTLKCDELDKAYTLSIPARDYSRAELVGRLGSLTNKFVKASALTGPDYLLAVDAASKTKKLELNFSSSEWTEFFVHLQ